MTPEQFSTAMMLRRRIERIEADINRISLSGIETTVCSELSEGATTDVKNIILTDLNCQLVLAQKEFEEL